MWQLRSHVDAAGDTLEHIEILGKALPAPANALVKGSTWDVFDTLHEIDQDVFLMWADGCETDTAVTHHDGRHAVLARRCQAIIPGRLAVVVGVRVDETGSNEEALGLDRLRGLRGVAFAGSRNGGDAPGVDGYIRATSRRARSVDEISVSNQNVHDGASCSRILISITREPASLEASLPIDSVFSGCRWRRGAPELALLPAPRPC